MKWQIALVGIVLITTSICEAGDRTISGVMHFSVGRRYGQTQDGKRCELAIFAALNGGANPYSVDYKWTDKSGHFNQFSEICDADNPRWTVDNEKAAVVFRPTKNSVERVMLYFNGMNLVISKVEVRSGTEISSACVLNEKFEN
jgi:hypothetical protein